MKLTNWALAIIIAMLALTGCDHSSPGIQVRDHNIAHMRQGQTLILTAKYHHWYITYRTDSVVHFDCQDSFCDDTDLTLAIGEKRTVDSQMWLSDDFTVSRVGDNEIDLVWPDGLNYQDKIGGVVPIN